MHTNKLPLKQYLLFLLTNATNTTNRNIDDTDHSNNTCQLSWFTATLCSSC